MPSSPSSPTVTRGRVDTSRDLDAVAQAAAAAIALAATAAIAARGRFDVALAGGSTPRRAYELLASQPLAWPQLHFWFGDERCVAPDHPESNYAMARSALFERAPIPAANVHRMRGEQPDRDAAARAYERELPAVLDLLLLGMGPDGHTASLFPGSGALREEVRRVVAVTASKPPPERLTITPPVIRAARQVVVLAAGKDKAAVLQRALEETIDPFDCPARLLRGATWLVDAAAASTLAPRRNA